MLGDRLGSGGMSTVYQATDRVLERTVAVKVLAEHLSDDEKFVARFRREALAVAKLVHPNIVQVYDTGVDAGRHFIVMEYVEGRSGAQLLQRDGALEPATAVEIAAQACAGLEYAHRMGIIHRDVKPGNLMVIGGPAGGPPEMTVKLADFGIARAAEQTRLTQVGSVVGTAAYLSPEQSRGEEATPISDVYSLGVVTYQLLTARLPYEGNSLAELAIRRENERPLPPTSYEKNIPEGLSQAVLRALENEPEDRYVDALAYGAALRAGLAGIAPAAEATTRLIDPRSTAATRVAPREPRTPTSPARAARPRRTSPPPRRARDHAGGQAAPQALAVQQLHARCVAILMIAIVAGLIAAVILLATDAGQNTDLGQYIGDNFDQSIATSSSSSRTTSVTSRRASASQGAAPAMIASR